MKSILKFLPVALGVLTIASCSNDDFFGSETQKNGKELIPTVENLVNADGGTTRSAWTAGGSYNVSWQEKDQFRVYDEAVQAYDIFSRKAAGITIDGDADVEAHKYALFPGNKVSYAGWDKTNGVSAVMLIDDKDWGYNGTKDAKKATFPSGEKMVYTSNLPMWGSVANETSENLEVDLKFLTSVLDVCIYQGAAQKIRVVAYEDKDHINGLAPLDADGNVTGNGKATADLTNLAKVKGKETPLSGYFFAQLKDGGQLVKDMNQPEQMTKEYGYTLEIGVANAGDEAHVLIPIIPATYEYLSVQYLVEDGIHTNVWKELKGYEKTEIKRGQVRKTGLEIGTAPTPAQVSSLKDLSELLNKTAVKSGMVLNVTIEEGKTLATSEDWNKIELPAKDLTVNIEGAINNSEPHAPLNIVSNADAGANDITLNVKGGISGTENIIINTDRDLTLAGTAACSDQSQNTIQKSGTGTLTYGLGEYESFSTAMVTEVAAGALTINSPNGTIGKVKNGSVAVVVNSGTVASIESTTGNVTVNKGAKVTSVTTGVAPAVAINASVENVTTASPAVTSEAETPVTIGTLTLKNITNDATLTLTASEEKLLKVTNLVAAKGEGESKKVAVTSKGKVAIINVTKNDDAAGFTFNTSELEVSAAKAKTTEINSKGEIYTAGQLAGVTTGKSYKLMVNIDAELQDWTGVNINGDFDGNGMTISNLNKAGLFNTISGGTIKNFKITTVNNNNDNNPTKGALANEATGTVTIKGVTITGAVVGKTTGATNKQIDLGGLIGKTNGTITLEDNQVTGSVNGFGNMGGYIGNVAGGTVNILTSMKNATKASDITFSQGDYVYAAADAAKCGTIGNFIGSITGTGVTVIVGSNDTDDATKGAKIEYFFKLTDDLGIKNATRAIALKYDMHKNGAKEFKGMYKVVEGQPLQYEIGFSTGSISKLTLYNKTKNDFGVPYSLSIDNINVFE